MAAFEAGGAAASGDWLGFSCAVLGLSAKPLLAKTMQSPEYAALSPDGARVAFVSRRSGFPELWLSFADGREDRRLTDFNGLDLAWPRWSPNSGRIVFEAAGQIAIADARTGGVARVPGVEGRWPSWSRDGNAIFFTASDGASVLKISCSGGVPRRVLKGPAAEALESSDGRYLYYIKPGMGLWRRSLAVQPGRLPTERRVLAGVGAGRWAIAREGLYFVPATARGGRSRLCFYPFKTARVKTVATFTPSAGPLDLSVSRQGRLLWAQVDHIDSDRVLGLATLPAATLVVARLHSSGGAAAGR